MLYAGMAHGTGLSIFCRQDVGEGQGEDAGDYGADAHAADDARFVPQHQRSFDLHLYEMQQKYDFF
ncbi:hypothetical protein [uncultured Cardiobacterium sp.]|uniref:hypothetical protein n=1 Tax=uncultured Cardiobacterium sp. TaxID=417619 RepID=UPI002614A237|nr:hypothetical protein [uncultured Cardiobacterium sp.]